VTNAEGAPENNGAPEEVNLLDESGSSWNILDGDDPKPETKFRPESDQTQNHQEEEATGTGRKFAGAGKASRKSIAEAGLILNMGNLALSTGLQMYAQTSSRKPFEITEEDLEPMIQYLAIGIEESGKTFFTWQIGLLISALLAVTPLAIKAHQTRQVKKAKAKKQENEPEVQIVPTEEVYTEEALENDLKRYNIEAEEAGIQQLVNHSPPRDGLCWYHHFVLGLEVDAAPGGKFQSGYGNKWKSVLGHIRHAGVELPLELRRIYSQ
jgi:hypothetical protein